MGDAILQAAGQAWPPFGLVTGLLLIGAVVEADGFCSERFSAFASGSRSSH